MTVPNLRFVGGILVVLLLVTSNSLIAGEPRFTDLQPPIRSVLELRQERVMIQKWDLSCGAAALGTLLRYQFGERVTEKEIARELMRRVEYVGHPELVQLREGFSLLDLKRFVESYHAKRFVAKSTSTSTPKVPKAATAPGTLTGLGLADPAAGGQRARLGLGRTFQTSLLFGALPVAENVRLAAQARPGRGKRLWHRPRHGDQASALAEQAIESVGLTQVAALDYADQGIRVNVLAPGTILTCRRLPAIEPSAPA